ncbi:MAG: YegS/Rv2252/BmrU family lipid kinase [Clostridia bacterium]|nr:YegS/Rv2252/BmrU family lipid kinase [Clostridia bacterium]
MKTVFIVNPKAGKKNNIESLTERIKAAAEKLEADVEIYKTKAVGDATVFVREFCEKHGKARFVACGGDGTLGEVVNGAVLFDGAEVGVMPFGTGNDFVKNFDGNFSDIESQITSESEKCDIIRYTTKTAEGERVGYCANMFNIGFDCNVVDAMENIKKKTVFSGPLAYFLGIFTTLVKKKGANLEIELDGKAVHNGKLLLTSIANGCFCGGGVKSNPLASVHDGLMNVNIINDVSRLKFITLLPYYMKGTHLQLKGIEKIISNVGCKKIVVRPIDGEMRLCTDGEITSAGETKFEILHDAFSFVIPKKKQSISV